MKWNEASEPNIRLDKVLKQNFFCSNIIKMIQ